MRSRGRAEERSRGQSRNAAQFRVPELVHHAADPTHTSRGGYRKLAPEDLAEIRSIFFNRPYFQIHTRLRARSQFHGDSAAARRDSNLAHGLAPPHIQSSRDAKQH